MWHATDSRVASVCFMCPILVPSDVQEGKDYSKVPDGIQDCDMSGMIVSADGIKLAAGTWDTECPNYALQETHAAKCSPVTLSTYSRGHCFHMYMLKWRHIHPHIQPHQAQTCDSPADA